MNAAHTPGPWDWRGMGRIRSNDGTHIADIWNENNGWMTEVEQANARLIAAAPAMLEALEALCNEQDARQGYASIETYDNARAVIRAAKGE